MSAPWILFHAPWTSRARSAMPMYRQLERFLDACAVDPRPDALELSIYEDHGEPLRRISRNVQPTPDNVARCLDTIGYRSGSLIDEATRAFGPGVHRVWCSGSSGFELCWQWRQERPLNTSSFVTYFEAHEDLPLVASRKPVDLMLSYWFKLKRPGTGEALFTGSPLSSSLMMWLGSRRANLSVRYDVEEPTPEFRELHAAIVATLGPKPPRGWLGIITEKPGGGEHRQKIG